MPEKNLSPKPVFANSVTSGRACIPQMMGSDVLQSVTNIMLIKKSDERTRHMGSHKMGTRIL